MDRNLFLFVGLLVAIYAGCSYWLWNLRRKTRLRSDSEEAERRSRRERRENLRAALIGQDETVDHRIDAATREASEGSETCAHCGFANFKRLRYCALCGEGLKKTIDILYAEAQPSDRLHRAIRRKEWGRRVDSQGRATWYQAKVPSKSSLPRGYVVQFHLPSVDKILPGDPLHHIDTHSKLTVAKKLAIEASAMAMSILDAATADASVFPNGVCVDLKSSSERDVLQMAEKDFPTKLAHFIVCSASQLVPAEVEVLKISVHRDFLVEDSINHLSCMESKYLHTVMRINFVKESGVDAGGVHREWFMLLSERLVDPSVGLFTCTNDAAQTYCLNALSERDNGPDHLAYFYAMGRLVGRALLEGDVLGFHFSTPLLKIMLGMPVSLDDLESVDPVTFKSLLWLLENDGVDSLGLDFTLTETTTTSSSIRTVELMAGGAAIQLTDANKHDYVERRLKYTLFESVSSQLYMLLKGLYEVVPLHLLMLFDPEEFDLVLCGSQDIDVADWQKHSKCSSNLTDTRVYRWFWEIVRDMPNEYRRRLLQFATGRSRVPLAGFKGLTSYDGRISLFTLKGISYDKSPYIRSHACFNRLDLPMYPTRDEMKTVIYGILATDIHGFTIN